MKHLPNLLSLARLAMAPYVYLLLLRSGDHTAVLYWFAAAALTDALDGWLARKMGTASSTGMVLDPIADKVLLDTTYLALAMSTAIPWWLAAMVLGRDVLILLAAGAMLALGAKKRSFPPSIWGKGSTILQMLFVVVVILYGMGGVVTGLAWATAALTVWSGVDYARRAAV